jgi:hypothetical protein
VTDPASRLSGIQIMNLLLVAACTVETILLLHRSAAPPAAPAAPQPADVMSVAPPDPGPPAPDGPPVAVVNGVPIGLRPLEDALLKKEGEDQVEDALHRQLEATDWAHLKDEDTLVATATWRLTRVGLVAQLLRASAGEAREDLINLELVEQALAKAHVTIDAQALDAEAARMEKRFHTELAAEKKPDIDFASFIQQTKKMSLDAFKREPGFRMLTGLHLLVLDRARSEMDDDELKAFFREHIDRYQVKPAVDIDDIFIPYRVSDADDGTHVVTDDEKVQKALLMNQMYDAIRRDEVSFATTFNTFGQSFDHEAVNGHVGWVGRDGTRSGLGTRRISSEAMDQAFAAQPPFPRLLPPIAGPAGIDIIQVRDRRAGRDPDFAAWRDQVIIDKVDAEIDARTDALLNDLRRHAVIDYKSLPALIEARAALARLPSLAAIPPSTAPVPGTAPNPAAAAVAADPNHPLTAHPLPPLTPGP